MELNDFLIVLLTATTTLAATLLTQYVVFKLNSKKAMMDKERDEVLTFLHTCLYPLSIRLEESKKLYVFYYKKFNKRLIDVLVSAEYEKDDILIVSIIENNQRISNIIENMMNRIIDSTFRDEIVELMIHIDVVQGLYQGLYTLTDEEDTKENYRYPRDLDATLKNQITQIEKEYGFPHTNKSNKQH